MSPQWNGDYDAVAQLLGQRAGLSFRTSQRESLMQAIDQSMHHLQETDFKRYLQRLDAEADSLDDLLVRATVGETYFFREPGQLNLIAELIVPELLEHRTPDATLSIWSAGCATGEEPYSVAMSLHRNDLLERVRIQGTDISREALRIARTATYRPWSLRGEGTRFAMPYLETHEGLFRVVPQIRETVQFEYLNLALDHYPAISSRTSHVDVILCRNVMIYFDSDTVESVIERLYRCLAPDGWLLTATSDPPLHECGLFDFVPTPYGLLFRKRESSATHIPVQLSDWNSNADDDDFANPRVAPPNRSFGDRTDDRPATRRSLLDRFAGDPSAGSLAEGSLSEGARASELADMPAANERSCETGSQTHDAASARIARAKLAADSGHHQLAIELTEPLLHHCDALVLHIQSLANQDLQRALQVCRDQRSHHALSPEIWYLEAMLLIDLGQHHEAVEALHRVLYLDHALPLAHFTLGSTLRTLGDHRSAIRAFRNTVILCQQTTSPESIVPLSQQTTVDQLKRLAQQQLTALSAIGNVETLSNPRVRPGHRQRETEQ